jgi:Immunoglobulin domain
LITFAAEKYKMVKSCWLFDVVPKSFCFYENITKNINFGCLKAIAVYLDVFFLLLTVPPDILYDETSVDQAVQEGENTTLVCRATGHPPPRITWRREDGEAILVRKGHRDLVKGRPHFYRHP